MNITRSSYYSTTYTLDISEPDPERWEPLKGMRHAEAIGLRNSMKTLQAKGEWQGVDFVIQPEPITREQFERGILDVIEGAQSCYQETFNCNDLFGILFPQKASESPEGFLARGHNSVALLDADTLMIEGITMSVRRTLDDEITVEVNWPALGARNATDVSGFMATLQAAHLCQLEAQAFIETKTT